MITTVTNNVNAQIFTQVIDEQELQFKVKLIDEFFRRFNYETDYKGDPITAKGDSIPLDTVAKRKNLMTLFNLDKFASENKELDSISSAFLDYVIKNDKKIHYADTTWQAEAVSSFTMGGKSYPLHLFLKTEQVKGVIYKWVITDALSPIWNSLNDTAKTTVNIFPGAHGSSFITVPELINLNATSVRAMFPNEYKTNNLTMFDYFVSTGKAKIQHINSVIYHFNIGDYNFTVERFEREKTYNKGWLISNIIKNK